MLVKEWIRIRYLSGRILVKEWIRVRYLAGRILVRMERIHSRARVPWERFKGVEITQATGTRI